MFELHINGVPVTFRFIGGQTVACLGVPRAEIFLTGASEVDAASQVVRVLSHERQSCAVAA